jgi:hypothetical protein
MVSQGKKCQVGTRFKQCQGLSPKHRWALSPTEPDIGKTLTLSSNLELAVGDGVVVDEDVDE